MNSPHDQPSTATPPFTQSDLKAYRHLKTFREALSRAQAKIPSHSSFSDPKRKLTEGDYLSLFLFGLLNPVARTLRGLHQASLFPKVQRCVCTRAVSLGSFSEAQSLINPELLKHIFHELSDSIPDNLTLPSHLRAQAWLARDGSIFAALPRMTWALYGGGREGHVNNAVKLHLSFNLLKDAPVAANITNGKTCERATLRNNIKPGAAYVGDRYYGEHYAYFAQLSCKKCRYVIRLLENKVVTTIMEELPLSPSDRAAGVQRQALVRLGSERTLSEVLRVVWVLGVGGQLLMLATNVPADELTAGETAQLYKARWWIEYFFRWVKCLMGCGHWIAEGPNGVATQLYLAMIGALLLQLDLGRRPSKRVWELLQWHQSGMIDDVTLEEMLTAQLGKEAKIRAAKNSH